MIDVDICKMVLAVAETENFSKAARKIYVSQPLLSKNISKLEERLDTKLFDRNSRPVTLTDSGRIFVEYAKKFVELETELMEELGEVNTRKSILTIGVNNAGSVYAGRLHAAFTEEYPDISLKYEHLNNEECEHALESGAIDIAVFNTPIESGAVEYHILEENQLYILISRDNKIFDGVGADLKDYRIPVPLDVDMLKEANLHWFCAPEGSGLARTERDFFRRCGIKPQRSVLEFPDARMSMVENGDGAAILTMDNARNRNIVCCTVKGIDLYRYIVLAKRRNTELSDTSKKYWNFAIMKKLS